SSPSASQTSRTLTIDTTSYEADGYEVSAGSTVITHTISEAQNTGVLSFSSSTSEVCSISQRIISGKYSRTDAVITFLRGGNCTVTISVASTVGYSAASDSITFALQDPGSVVRWGSFASPPFFYEGELASKTVTILDIGGASTLLTMCAIADGRVFCWGENGSGQLGINSTSDQNAPVAVHTVSDGTGSELPDDAEIRSISVGVSGHTCVTAMPAGGTSDTDMRAYCWGSNSYGQLGDGTTDSSLVPVEVDDCDCGSTIISAGYHHTCAVIGGHAACWGYGARGQIGDGLTDNISTPTYVAEIDDGDRCTDPAVECISALPTGAEITQIEAGPDATCAIADGELYCWGQNNSGQLGNGTTTDALIPVAVSTSSGMTGEVTDVAIGGKHGFGGAHSNQKMFTCAVASGDAWCWGSDASGQIGNGSSGGGSTPSEVLRENEGGDLPQAAVVDSIDAGYLHACLSADGAAYCWGNGTKSPSAASTSVGSALRESRITKVSVTGGQSGASLRTYSSAIREFVRSSQTISFSSLDDVDHLTSTVDIAGSASASSGLDVS
ncbi:MAG: RCC1 domain-containing protein, partial [Ilumatobacteraceae bacterium]